MSIFRLLRSIFEHVQIGAYSFIDTRSRDILNLFKKRGEALEDHADTVHSGGCGLAISCTGGPLWPPPPVVRRGCPATEGRPYYHDRPRSGRVPVSMPARSYEQLAARLRPLDIASRATVYATGRRGALECRLEWCRPHR